MSERVTKTEITPSVKRRVAASVFIVAFAFGLNITGILPVLGILNEKYQQYGTSAVQLLQTIMYLLLIVGSLMVGWMTTKISKKKYHITGTFDRRMLRSASVFYGKFCGASDRPYRDRIRYTVSWDR